MSELFTFDYIKNQYQHVIEKGYSIITCSDYIQYKKQKRNDPVLVNRVDIDLSVKKAGRLLDIFNELGIRASFFIRLHAPEYNPFSFENYRIIKKMIDSGHELGYHSEVVDQSIIWNEDPSECLKRDIKMINLMYGLKIKGVASHRGLTGCNNLDFWKDNKPGDFGLMYEAYDKEPEFNLFNESLFISDSEWTNWKCYDKGILIEGDRRNIAEHADDSHNVLYVLIHPDTYFERHFYE